MLENCTPTQCGDVIALIAISITVAAGLLGVACALLAEFFSVVDEAMDPGRLEVWADEDWKR